jgi:hypothetical protein
MWTGCAFSPLGSNRAVSPVSVPIDYEGLARLSVSDEGMTAPHSLSITQAETLWGKLAAETPELACQSAGEEIVIRHIYGEKDPGLPWSQLSGAQKMTQLVVLGLVCWGFAELMAIE